MTPEDIRKAKELSAELTPFKKSKKTVKVLPKAQRVAGSTERLSATARYLKDKVIKEATPIKGRDYFDGKEGPIGPRGFPGKNGRDGRDGTDGKSPDVAAISRKVKEDIEKLIPEIKEPSPQDIVNKINTLPGSIAPETVRDLATHESTLEFIKSRKGNDRIDISQIRNGEQLARLANKKSDMSDQRWHGGGYIGVNTQVITVDTVAPTSPHIGDLWVDNS